MTGNIYCGLHDFVSMSITSHFLREGDLFLDIGANVGSYTVLGAGVCRAHVWAIEPDPGSAEVLRRNVDLNNLGDRVAIHQIALGDFDGEVSFTHDLGPQNRVAKPSDTHIQTVPTHRLDSIIGNAQPFMLKVDAEGHDDAILRGAVNLLAQNGLKLIVVESLIKETEKFLYKNGFEQVNYDPFSRKITDPSTRVWGSNRLFVRDIQFVARRLESAPSLHVFNRSI